MKTWRSPQFSVVFVNLLGRERGELVTLLVGDGDLFNLVPSASDSDALREVEVVLEDPVVELQLEPTILAGTPRTRAPSLCDLSFGEAKLGGRGFCPN